MKQEIGNECECECLGRERERKMSDEVILAMGSKRCIYRKGGS